MALSALDKKYPSESQHNPAFIPRDEVEYVFDEMAEFVVSATRKNCPETGDSVIAKGEYRLTLGDMRGLSYYVRDLTDELFKPKKHRTMQMMKHSRPTPVVFNPPIAMQPTGSTTADPITSLNTSPADGPIRFPGFPRRRRRLPGPSMATFVSAENVTEITWFGPISGYPSSDELEAEEDTLPSPETREIPAIVVIKPSEEETGSSAGNRQGMVTAEGTTRVTQNSRQVLAAVGEEATQLRAQDEPEPPRTILGKMRRKSAELGQTVSGFMNGAYRNPDYKPRRESSALRMRAILDRLSPPLPSAEDNADVFSALTGARPVTPEDVSKAKGREKTTQAG